MTAIRQSVHGRTRAAAGLAVACILCLVAMPANLRAGQAYSVSGIGGGPDTLNAYQGLIWAPFTGLSASGLIVRAWAKSNRFFYETDLPGRPDTDISVMGTGLEAEAGWQFASDHGRIAAYGGVAWRDHHLTPSDPGSSLSRARTVFKATVDGEWRFTHNSGIMANASYLTGLDQYWSQARPFFQFDTGWKLGADIAFAGGPDYSYGRAGVFVSGFELNVPLIGQLFIGGEAGAQYDLEDERVEPYAGINVGRLF